MSHFKLLKSTLLIVVLLLVTSQFSNAQNGEFEIQDNGLIYSESTMANLRAVVDSLNLKFRVCDIDKSFYSNYQVLGHKIKIRNGQVKEARKDMENNMGFKEFINKYPNAEVTKHVLIVRNDYENHDKERVVEFNEVSFNDGYGLDLRFSDSVENYTTDNLDNWVFKYYSKSAYSKESISAFYIPNKFESKQLPKKYSQMISYSDCLIDTTATKFKADLEYGWVELPENWKQKSNSKQEELLDQLRSTRVVGSCSQDSSPRRHAVNIAMLSASTQNWEIFLRAHLDVMNDRFERVSDGSYAYAQRNTYIKELEELNINVLDLIVGISLRVENPANNHYYGSVSRVGRALSETANKEDVEKQLFSIIENKDLDMYNRALGYYLVMNYIYHQDEESEKTRLKKLLIESIRYLPKEVHEQIIIE